MLMSLMLFLLYLVLLERLEVLPPLGTVLFWPSPLSLRFWPRVNSSVSFRSSRSRLLRPTSAGPTSEENKLSPSVSSWLVEMLISNSSAPIRPSIRTLQMRFGESGGVSRPAPSVTGLAVLSIWLLLPSHKVNKFSSAYDGSRYKLSE